MAININIDSKGRRVYLRGDTFPLRDRLREIGARWDPAERAWWVSSDKRDRMERLVESADRPAPDQTEPTDRLVGARANYKGRPCYVAARESADDDDGVSLVTTRDGSRMLLVSHDGTRQWWASATDVRVTKQYQAPMTIGSLRDYAMRAKNGEEDLSYSAYLAEIEGAEDMDCFTAARALERMGYREWRAMRLRQSQEGRTP